MLSAITIASMQYTTALNASKKENDTNYRFEIFLCVCSNCDVTIHQNHFAGVALFLAGEDRIGYFSGRSRRYCLKNAIGLLLFEILYNFYRSFKE